MTVHLILPDGRTLENQDVARVPCVGEHVLYLHPTSFKMTAGRVTYVLLVASDPGDAHMRPFDAEVQLEVPK